MTLHEILQAKGPVVHSISPSANLDDVVQKLVKHNCGSLIVLDDDNRMVGIVTERDILRACASGCESLCAISVASAMTSDIVTGLPGDSVEHIMGLMTVNRVRHLPVVEDGHLKGIISIGDVVKAQHDQLTIENHYLKTYIHGEADEQSFVTGTWRPR